MHDVISSDSTFGPHEREALRALAELMIPERGTLPPASDDLIMGQVFARLAGEAGLVKASLEELDGYAVQETGCSLSELDPMRRLEIVERTDRRDFIGLFQVTVLSAYFQDDRVMREIGLEPRPAWPEGYDVPPTDWSILDPVRERGAIWRPVPGESRNKDDQ